METRKGRKIEKLMKISVISPSVRPEGLNLVKKALSQQTFHDFEWIVGTKKNPHISGSTWVEDNFSGGYWSLYRIYNKMLKKARGDLIISLQDFTYMKPDALQCFWGHYMNNPKSIIGAVGNKYTDDNWTVQTWQDPRERLDQGTFYQCFPNDVEINLASFPKQAFYDVGGFDEFLDAYSSFCGLDVLLRLEELKTYSFWLDQTIKSYSLEHGRLPEWDNHLPFGEPYQKRVAELKLKGQWPKLHYL